MAIDTALKRFSAINVGNPWRNVLPIPDGTIGAADRQIVVRLYSGILAGGSSDTTPDQFTFTDQSGVALSSTITSAAVTITGIDTTVSFAATGGTIDVNADGNFQTSRDVVNGDQIRARHTSSASYLTATNTAVTGGGVSDTFTSTTEGEPNEGASGRKRIDFGFGLGV